MVETDEELKKLDHGQALVYSDEFLYIDEPWILTRTWLAKFLIYLGKLRTLITQSRWKWTEAFARPLSVVQSCLLGSPLGVAYHREHDERSLSHQWNLNVLYRDEYLCVRIGWESLFFYCRPHQSVWTATLSRASSYWQ